MDSLTQLTLGAAVGVAVMGRRTAVWKAALWGGVCGTLPDLDALIDHGDAIRNMTFHRAESHSLFWLSLLAPLLAWGIARWYREGFRRWWLAVWLALVTHPLLDAMTVYGTQLALPFTDHPYAVGSVFIIDPLYTLPLLVGVTMALRSVGPRGRAWNHAGLGLSSLYLCWSMAAQQHVLTIARAELQAQGVAVDRLLVTPAPFTTLLWRVVAVTPDHYLEGFYSVLDSQRRIELERFERGMVVGATLRHLWPVERLAWFSKGFYRFTVAGQEVWMSDLRMGQEPFYLFSFTVARHEREHLLAVRPVQVGQRMDLEPGLAWLWRRALGQPLAPPR